MALLAVATTALLCRSLGAQTVDPCHPPFSIAVVRTACKLGTAEARVRVTPTATVHWQFTGGTITAGQDTATVGLAFFAVEQATLTAAVTDGGCTASSSVAIALREPFAVDALAILPDPPIRNAPATLLWRYRGTDVPRTQHVRIGDAEVPVRDTDRTVTFTPQAAGVLRVRLAASTVAPVGRRRAAAPGDPLPPASTCTDATRELLTSVREFPAPAIDYFTADSTSVPVDRETTLRFGLRDATDWALNSALANCFSQNFGSGSGSFTVIFDRCEAAGHDTVTLTATGPGGATTAALTIYNPPYILAFSADSTIVPVGGTTTLRFRIGQTTRWTLTAERGSTITPATGTEGSGIDSGVLTAMYQRQAAGADSVTLSVTGLGGTTSATITIQ